MKYKIYLDVLEAIEIDGKNKRRCELLTDLFESEYPISAGCYIKILAIDYAIAQVIIEGEDIMLIVRPLESAYYIAH